MLGETQLLGLHLETQALYVDETGVSVLFTHTSPGLRIPSPPLSLLASLSHQHFPPLSSNIPNNPLLHPFSHPLPSSQALQALNLALISLSLKPSPSSPASFTPSSLFPSLLWLAVCLSLPHSLFSLPSSPPPIISLGSVHCCSADEGEDIAASALIL